MESEHVVEIESFSYGNSKLLSRDLTITSDTFAEKQNDV